MLYLFPDGLVEEFYFFEFCSPKVNLSVDFVVVELVFSKVEVVALCEEVDVIWWLMILHLELWSEVLNFLRSTDATLIVVIIFYRLLLHEDNIDVIRKFNQILVTAFQLNNIILIWVSIL